MKLHHLLLIIGAHVQLYAMELEVRSQPHLYTKARVVEISRSMDRSIVLCHTKFFIDLVRIYRIRKTQAARDALIRLYESAHETIRESYLKVLQKLLLAHVTIETIRADEIYGTEGKVETDSAQFVASCLIELDQALDLIKLSTLKRLHTIADCSEKNEKIKELQEYLKKSRYPIIRKEAGFELCERMQGDLNDELHGEFRKDADSKISSNNESVASCCVWFKQGEDYLFGRGVPRDEKQAFEYFMKVVHFEK